jgi:hypothetical protein
MTIATRPMKRLAPSLDLLGAHAREGGEDV